MFDDQLRLQKIISSLKGLLSRTQDLKTRFVALSAGLKIVSISSRSLLDVWDDVAARLGPAIDDMDLIPASQAQQLKRSRMRAKVAIDAKDCFKSQIFPALPVPTLVPKNPIEL